MSDHDDYQLTPEDYQDLADQAFEEYCRDLELKEKEQHNAFTFHAPRLDAELRPGADSSDPALSI